MSSGLLTLCDAAPETTGATESCKFAPFHDSSQLIFAQEIPPARQSLAVRLVEGVPVKVPLEVRLAAWRSRESAPAPRAPTEGPAPRAPAEGPAPAAPKPVAPKSRAGAPVPRAPAEDPAPAPAREPATSAAAEPLRRSKRGAPAPLKPQPYVEVPRLKDVWPSTPALAAAATNPSVDELSVDATAGLGPVGDAALTAAAVLPHRPTTSTKAEPSIDELVAHATAGNAGDPPSQQLPRRPIALPRRLMRPSRRPSSAA